MAQPVTTWHVMAQTDTLSRNNELQFQHGIWIDPRGQETRPFLRSVFIRHIIESPFAKLPELDPSQGAPAGRGIM